MAKLLLLSLLPQLPCVGFIPFNIGLQIAKDDAEVLNSELGYRVGYHCESGNQYNNLDDAGGVREAVHWRGPGPLPPSSKEPSRTPQKQALWVATRLKDKSTNLVVNPARFKDTPPQTPLSQSGRTLLLQIPPLKRHRADAPKQLSISSSHYLSGPSLASAKPTLESQNFTNVRLASKSNHQRLSVLSTSTQTKIADHPQPFREPPRQSRIFEQPPTKDSALNFIDKAKGVVTDTTRAAVKFLPSLVLPTPKVKREQIIESLRQTGTEVRPSCSWRAMPPGKNIRKKDCKEVTGATHPEDNHRNGSSIASKEYTPRYLEVGESCQNLLDESTSNKNGRGLIYAADPYETSEASGAEMTSGSNSRKFVVLSTSADSWGRQGRHLRNRRKDIFDDDAEQGFEGDVDMYTEDDLDPDTQDTEDSHVIGVNPLTISQEDLSANLGGDCAMVRGYRKRYQRNSQMSSDSDGHTPQKVKGYDRLMEVALATRKHQSPRQPIGKRHLPTMVGPNPTFLPGHKRASLLDGPPEDISNLSEDELCSPQYIIGCDTPGVHQQRTISKSKEYKKKSIPRGGKKSVAEPMELD